MVTCRKKRMLKNPCSARPGRQNQRRKDQLVCGRFSGVQRRPISITATLYPFSTSRCAVTLPPNPEPMTMKSKSYESLLCGTAGPSVVGVMTGKLEERLYIALSHSLRCVSHVRYETFAVSAELE